MPASNDVMFCSRIFNVSVACVLFCTQFAGCSLSEEIQPLSESEFVYLQAVANDVLPPVRESSNCDLLVSSLNRGWFTEPVQYTIVLIYESDACLSVIDELSRIGEPDGISFVATTIVQFPVHREKSEEPGRFDLIHEIDPADGI